MRLFNVRSRSSARSTSWLTTLLSRRRTSSIEEISSEEWDHTFRTNLYAYFYLTKAAAKHMQPGGSIIATSSVNAKTPSPQLLAYATTKGAIANLTAGLAQLLAEKGLRVNCIGPGPVWTPLIPSTMPKEKVKEFGATVPLARPAQPVELAPPYVMLASDEFELHFRRLHSGNRRQANALTLRIKWKGGAAGCGPLAVMKLFSSLVTCSGSQQSIDIALPEAFWLVEPEE